MKKISGPTFHLKVLFPIAWVGVLLMIVVPSIVNGALESSVKIIAVPAVMIAFGSLLFKKLVWDLISEVIDEGDSLLFRRGKKEQRVFLRDITGIKYSRMMNPERGVIKTCSDGAIGKELVFTLPARISFFSKSPVIVDLIERVGQARNEK